MSDEETVTVDTSEAKLLTAEYRDGQLQIVEVTPFDKSKESHIVPDQIIEDDDDGKYTMVETDKGLMQLDLLNLTLVRCEDGEESYQLVTGDEGGDELATDGTVTCVLQSSDSDDHDQKDSYVMMENEQGSLVILQPSQIQSQAHSEPSTPALPKVSKQPSTAAEILEKAKVMKKAKSILAQLQSPRLGKRGRKRKSEIPPPHELLASPNFKLYLYSCKLCSFKCNAVKELTAHKATVHGPGGKLRALRGGASLQCARCPYKAATPSLLVKHMESHEPDFNSNDGFHVTSGRVDLDSLEVAEADVLVCGACGFESPSRDQFRRHIETSHGVVSGTGS